METSDEFFYFQFLIDSKQQQKFIEITRTEYFSLHFFSFPFLSSDLVSQTQARSESIEKNAQRQWEQQSIEQWQRGHSFERRQQ